MPEPETNTTQQTSIVPPAPIGYPGEVPAPRPAGADWLPALPEKAKPSFFQPDSTPQRVIVLDVTGHGPDGVTHVIAKSNDQGVILETKQTKKYADLLLRDAQSGREMLWEVLSLPAALQVRDALVKAGPDYRGNLVLSIHTEGRGLKKVFVVVPVAISKAPPQSVIDEETNPADPDA
jgi:hypothetical protein